LKKKTKIPDKTTIIEEYSSFTIFNNRKQHQFQQGLYWNRNNISDTTPIPERAIPAKKALFQNNQLFNKIIDKTLLKPFDFTGVSIYIYKYEIATNNKFVANN
jgi:hypothetical protein